MGRVVIFALIWFAVNVVQSALLELAPDEAYYWLWSNYLDFGYFDHPPAVAFFIKMGYSVLQNELGVRLLTVLFSSLLIIIVFLMTNRTKPNEFILLTMSIPIVHAGGFIAVPDTFLIFFTALFFLSIKMYFEGSSYALPLAILSSSGMFYSKYHAILVVILTLLAYPRFLKTEFFYKTALFTFMFYIPHIIWQISNGFPSIKYHLLERHRGFDWENVLNYIVGQIGVFGIFVFLIAIFTIWNYKSRNNFERIMKFNLWGVLLFFFISSFRGHVEANWTATALIPFVILAYNSLKNWKLMYPFMIFNIVLLAILRIHAIKPFIPLKNDPISQFHGWKNFAGRVENLSGGKPIVANTYQIASELSFYTGKIVPSLNENARKNQFSIWKFHRKFKGKSVFFITPYYKEGYIKLMTPIGVRYAGERKM